MPTKRTRKTRNIITDVSDGALWVMGDEVLYPEPDELNDWELDFVPGFRHPTASHTETCRSAWDACKADILSDWITRFPGTRPQYWWTFDSPRMSQEDVKKHGWIGWFFVSRLCEPRRRVGGTGTPAHEVLNYVPSFSLGIPDQWLEQDDVELYNGRTRHVVTGELITADGKWKEGNFAGKAIDANNPPRYESQASYLTRHSLLLPAEKSRLRPADFEPELITVFEEIETESPSRLSIKTAAPCGESATRPR